jgi:hypothetical protein
VALALVLTVTAVPAAAAADPGPPAPATITNDGAADAAADEIANGRLPIASLQRVGGVLLDADAAVALELLIDAARRDGVTLRITDGYRSYDEQVDVKRRKGWLAATPGTSLHGWGIAIDVDTGVTDMAWMHANAPQFGWIHPSWARPGGSKPEPWHWEFVGWPGDFVVGPEPTPVVEEGDLVAELRLEPVEGEAGAWLEVREGLEDLASGVRHYPGTAGPGGRGNFAVAGYHRSSGAALAGVERLVPGDRIVVRSSDREHRYVVVDRAVLGPDDGWAVGPDPLRTGTPRMLTLTTGDAGGRLSVVWARSV